MPDWRNSLAAVGSRWNALRPRDRLVITLGAALLAAVLLYSAISSSSAAMGVLFSNLSEEDSTRIGERLKAMNVPYQLSKNGGAILVPEEQVHQTRMSLASEGLPGGEGVGFEIFDQQRFGESEFSEQIKYHRALEGELARTITHMTGVQRARVHLVLPTGSLFASNEQKASASIALNLKPGWRVKDEQVKGIVHLVASSVRGLDPEQVVVVDDQGRRLTENSRNPDNTGGQDLGIVRQIERSKEEAIQQMLDVALGEGKSAARVAAKVSFVREERTEEQYDPQTIATRSFQIVEERNGRSTITTGGVPGTVSNLPGGDAPLPGGSAGQQVERRSETRNFEVTKVVRRAVEPAGKVEGLQVAVLVDGYWKGAGKQRKFQARSQAELDRIKAIAASAVGLDATRGDRITVDCMPFAATPETGTEAGSGLSAAKDFVRPFMPYLVGGFFVLLLTYVFSYLLQLGGRVARTIVGPPREEHAALGNPALREQALSAGETANASEVDQVRLLSANLANHEPEVAARVVRGWLTEQSDEQR